MSIASALQSGVYTIAYNMHGEQILMVVGELVGYTSSSISVKSGSYIITYNANGQQISALPT